MKKRDLVLVFFLFLFAFVLRVWFLRGGSLTFGYDQARDALVTSQILGGDLKILGPPASTPGLYHGVFYYYFLAPAYLIGAGSPVVAAYWTALFNALAVFLVFYLAFLLSGKKLAGFLAAFLFAISFEATQYATWLSNPTLGVWTVPLMYLGLWLWVKEKKKIGPILAAVGLGLSVQSEIFLLYHLVPLAIWLLASRKELKKRDLISFILFFLLSVSSMILVEFKFGFKGLSGIKQLAISQPPSLAYADSLGDYLILYLNQIGRIFAFNSYPGNIGYGGALVIVLSLLGLSQSLKKESLEKLKRKGEIHWGAFLATWLFAHLTVVTVGGTSTPFLMVGIGPAVSVLLGIFLASWWEEKKKVLTGAVLFILIFGNLSMIWKENPRGATLFAIQKDMLLSKQKAAIDYMYQKADGEMFSVNSLTSPLWINIVWTYLFKWYGLPQYKYIPEWHGRGQEGQLDSLPLVSASTEKYFLILEPMGGIPVKYLEQTINAEDSQSQLIDEQSFGELRIQERIKLAP